MTSTTTTSTASARDLIAIAICTLCWGTTFYAITLQLGVVDPVISVVYRFFIASALLFVFCAVRREPIRMNLNQHLLAIALGGVTFGVNYPLVYIAEERVTSAVAAVMFAAMAFLNLIAFRLAFGQRASAMAWFAASLGVVGVAVLSWEEVTSANFGARAMVGVALLVAAVVAAAIGNIFARRIELSGVGVAASTGWAMFYGASLLTIFSLVTGRTWNFELSWPYVLSMAHLAVNGSVVAFVLYYGVARRRGYATAAYISALTPPLAMFVSSLFEDKTWGMLALVGIAIVLVGQWLLLKEKRA